MTIYLTSAGAVGQTRRGKARPETAAGVGPGRAFSIMRNPRPPYGEVLDGRVLAFTPPARLLAPAPVQLPAEKSARRPAGKFGAS